MRPKCSTIGGDEKLSTNNSSFPATNRPNAINSYTVITHLLVWPDVSSNQSFARMIKMAMKH